MFFPCWPHAYIGTGPSLVLTQPAKKRLKLNFDPRSWLYACKEKTFSSKFSFASVTFRGFSEGISSNLFRQVNKYYALQRFDMFSDMKSHNMKQNVTAKFSLFCVESDLFSVSRFQTYHSSSLMSSSGFFFSSAFIFSSCGYNFNT